MKRKKVLLTGATGNMGMEALKFFYLDKDKYHLIIFALPGRSDKYYLKRYENDESVTIFWGDLTNYGDVKKAVALADIILHAGALVSPMADNQPEMAWKVNFTGTKNIVDAIREDKEKAEVKLIYVGSVAESGNRVAPYHWGRVGDPLLPSAFDYYAISKIAAERYVIESGLKYWVSVRQTGILHDSILEVNDGIGYHMPLDNHMEWVSARDSGRLLYNACSDEVSEMFWRNVYNIGGGETCRLTGYDFLNKVYRMMGVDFRKFEDPNWYALRNFHGQWYYDSDKLDDLLHFRSESVDDVISRIKKKLPLKFRLLKYLPNTFLRKKMREMAKKGDTPLNWVKSNNESKINAFFASIENWENIADWDRLELVKNPPPKILDHGYDESKPDKFLSLEDMKKAAGFRGGVCLSGEMETGDLNTKLDWKCEKGHEFTASPFLVLKTGHWCPECIKPPWNFDAQAKKSPFIAQLWYSDHDEEENKVYI